MLPKPTIPMANYQSHRPISSEQIETSNGFVRQYRVPQSRIIDRSTELVRKPVGQPATHDLQKPRQIYEMIKQSYNGLPEPDVRRIAQKIHREVEQTIEKNPIEPEADYTAVGAAALIAKKNTFNARNR